MEMPVMKRSMGNGVSAAPPLATDPTVAEAEEPFLTTVNIKGLSRSPSRSDDDVDWNQVMTPAEREILEIYEYIVNSRHSSFSQHMMDCDLLQQILSNLNDIGQLGCYGLHFNRADSRVFFSLLDSSQKRHSTFDQIRNLVRTIKQWVKEFAKYDQNYAEFLPFNESWEAFSSLGFQINNETKEVIVLFYSSDKQGLQVSDFIKCAAKISATRMYWATKTQDESSIITFEEVLQRVLMT